MPKKDKTFFGKIMGDQGEEEEMDQDFVPQDQMMVETDEVEELVDDEPYDEDDESEDYGDQSEPKVKKDEEWLNDYEGQLNIDMFQTKDNVIIKSTIAGVRPEDIDITVANDMVNIKGTRRKEETIATDDYFYQECYWGNFSRSVIVPVDIDSENIEADLKDGILTVIIPKAAKAKTKKVKVKGA
jgi:HSP20 family protein